MGEGIDGLGSSIRLWRNRLTPEAAGLAPGLGRRISGLRREELALLAGVSVDYLVRLEQGRATTPSIQVTSALARALQLDVEERNHLYSLAGHAPPAPDHIDDFIPQGILRTFSRIEGLPVGVFAPDWRLIWWSSTWAALLGDPTSVAPADRSLVRARFPIRPDDPARVALWPVTSLTSTDQSGAAIISDLRSASARFRTDPKLRDLIAAERAANEEFETMWRRGTVGHHTSDRKAISHPTVGRLVLDCDVMADVSNGLKIVLYTAVPGSDDESKMDLVRVVGASQTVG